MYFLAFSILDYLTKYSASKQTHTSKWKSDLISLTGSRSHARARQLDIETIWATEDIIYHLF